MSRPYAVARFSFLFLSALVAVSAQTNRYDPLLRVRPTDRITSTVDAQRFILRPGNIHPLARPQFDRGAVAADFLMQRIILLLRPDPAQQAAMDRLEAAQMDAASPLFHHWLSPDVFGAHFGISDHDLRTLTQWLTKAGFTVEPAPASRLHLIITGTAQTVEGAFHTSIHTYSVNNEIHHANATDPSIPEALSNVVEGPLSLDDFVHGHTPHAQPNAQIGNEYIIAPSDFATIYNLNPLYATGLKGTGVSAAIVARSNILLSDYTSFQNTFGSGATLQVRPAGADPGVNCTSAQLSQSPLPTACGDWQEATIDVERIGATAPGANVILVPAASTRSTDGIALSAQYIINSLTAVSVMSMSFSSCESDMSSSEKTYWQNLWKQAQSAGISVFVSSGDAGVAGCDSPDSTTAASPASINGLCSASTVVCVGGTQFLDTANPALYWSGSGSALGYIPEAVWNESGNVPPGGACTSVYNGHCGLWASGGGPSTSVTKPAWQQNITPADLVRDTPDVSLSAAGHDSYDSFFNGAVSYFLGTSLSAPSFAGITAVMVQNKALQRLGSPNPSWYQFAASSNSYANPFHYTTTGNNAVPGLAGYSATGAGYNLATGLGSVDATLLAQAFNGVYQPSLTLTPSATSISIFPGGSAQLTVHVATGGGFAAAVSLSSCPVSSSLPPGLTLLSQSASGLPAPGSGDITFSVGTSASTSSGTWTITACGQGLQASVSIAVTVIACSFSLTPASVGLASTSGTGQLTLTAPSGCGWSVSSFSPWVSSVSPLSGVGSSPINFSYLANTSQMRSGIITVSGSIPGASPQTVSSVLSQSAAAGVTPATALRFLPVTPCRLVDTRNAAGPFGAPFLAAGTSRSFTLPSSPACSIPTTAQAYSLNVTVVPHGSLSFLTIWPTGQGQPLVSTLNSLDGRIKANAAIVPAGVSGAVSVYATNDADVILDIDGYFTPDTGALAFYPISPCRAVDTRISLGTAAITGPLLSGIKRTLPLLSGNCGLPSSAQAYSLNITAIPSGSLGYLTVFPTGLAQPTVSTLNAFTGTPTANAAIIASGASGSIDVFATNTSDLVVDVNGYFAPASTGGLSFYALPPCRVFDTRNASPPTALNGYVTVNVLAGNCGTTMSAQAYVQNATVVPVSFLGYLELWPDGAPQPVVSTLNALDGAITSNMAIVTTTDTQIRAFTSGSTALILDLSGYFAQ